MNTSKNTIENPDNLNNTISVMEMEDGTFRLLIRIGTVENPSMELEKYFTPCDTPKKKPSVKSEGFKVTVPIGDGSTGITGITENGDADK